MAAHASLTGANLHEPKSADTAAAGDMYVFDGGGSGGLELIPGRTYGGICSKDSSIAISTIGTTPQELAGFDAAMPSNNTTPAHATDDITIISGGDYYVSFSLTLATAAVGDAGIYQFHLRVNGAESTNYATRIEMSGSNDTANVGFSGATTLIAADVLTIWVESDEGANTDDITIEASQFSVFLLKET